MVCENELRDAVHPWTPTKTMITLVGSMVVREHEEKLCVFIEGKQLLLQESAIDAITQWSEELGPLPSAIKTRVSEVLEKASVGSRSIQSQTLTVPFRESGIELPEKETSASTALPGNW